MKKVKKLAAFFLVLILIFSLAGCGNPQKRIIVYGRFQDNYTTDRFDVFCDWETINPLLDKCNFKAYGLHTCFLDKNDSFNEFEKKFNVIWLGIDSLNDENTKNAIPGSYAQVSYGAQLCNSIESQNHVGDRFFTEPMIQIKLYNPKAKRREDVMKPDYIPDYILGYRAVYSLNGELALEEGVWFLEEDKDKFCRHYFEIMLKIIGKGT